MKTIKIILLLTSFCLVDTITPKFFILIGPSGVGKTTLIKKLDHAGLPFNYLITHTTRPIRPQEQHGKDYFFLTSHDFIQKEKNNEFLTTSVIYGNRYGILKEYIHTKLQEDKHLVSCLTADIAHLMKAQFNSKVTTVFIAPPCLEELKRRLIHRHTESQHSLKTRLEMAEAEMQHQHIFDHHVINNDLDLAAHALKDVFSNNSK